MLELLGNTLVLFLLIYACLNIAYKLANYLMAKLSRAKSRRSFVIVFSDHNTEELEGIVRSMNCYHTDVCIVDIDTSEEGRRILACLERELDYVHIMSERSFLEEVLQQSRPMQINAEHLHQ